MQASKAYVLGLLALAVCVVLVSLVPTDSGRTVLISEWDVLSDNTPVAAISQPRRAREQSLMYGHVDLPDEKFSWKNESPDGVSGCEDKCAFRDKYFTVEDWDKMCITHCGDIDAILKALHQRQVLAIRKSTKLASVRRQALNEEEQDHLENQGVKVQDWPLAEKEMPEQHISTDSFVDGVQDFFGTGKKLKNAGVNVDDVPLKVNTHSSGDDVMMHDGVKVDSWPWDAEHESESHGLQGVHVSGWDGDAFFRQNEQDKQGESGESEH